MPTAAKLVAALLFAALAWGASRLALPALPEAARPAWFAAVNAGVGAIVGWRVAGARSGARAGATLAGAAGIGLTAAMATVAVALSLHGLAEMLRLSLRKRYDGPFEALGGAVEIALALGGDLATPAPTAALAAGAVAAGLLTGWAGRRWR